MPPHVLSRYALIEFYRTLDLCLIRVTLCYTSDQLERPEGIKSETAVFAVVYAIFLTGKLFQLISILIALRSAGVDSEYTLA